MAPYIKLSIQDILMVSFTWGSNTSLSIDKIHFGWVWKNFPIFVFKTHSLQSQMNGEKVRTAQNWIQQHEVKSYKMADLYTCLQGKNDELRHKVEHTKHNDNRVDHNGQPRESALPSLLQHIHEARQCENVSHSTKWPRKPERDIETNEINFQHLKEFNVFLHQVDGTSRKMLDRNKSCGISTFERWVTQDYKEKTLHTL